MTAQSAKNLFFHEEVLLLVLRDEKGTPEFGAMYAYAMAGGILAELLLAGRITVDEGKRKLVGLVDDAPMGDAVLDECLTKVATAKRRASTTTWVQRFAHVRRLHHRVAEGLCRQKVLRADEDKVLLIFKRTVYPEIDPKPERKIIERLDRAIFTDTDKVDPRTVILIALAQAADLLRIHFERRELKKRKQRIKHIADGDLMGTATKEAVVAAQTAVMVASIMPAMMAATIASTSS